MTGAEDLNKKKLRRHKTGKMLGEWVWVVSQTGDVISNNSPSRYNNVI